MTHCTPSKYLQLQTTTQLGWGSSSRNNKTGLKPDLAYMPCKYSFLLLSLSSYIYGRMCVCVWLDFSLPGRRNEIKEGKRESNVYEMANITLTMVCNYFNKL